MNTHQKQQLNQQEKPQLNFPDLEQLRARGTRKWTVFDDDVLPLWVAESDFPTASPVHQRIRDAVEAETFGYSPAPHTTHLAESIADFYADYFGWRPDPHNIVWCADVVRGLLLGLQYFTREDSAVIIPTPSYPPLLELPGTAGREKIEVDAYGGLNLDEIEKAFQNGAGALVLSNPYNPLGEVFSRETLTRLVELADAYDARLLLDEIHAPLVYDGEHVPAASLSEKAARVCFTVTAASKAWNIAGLKCAQIIFSNDADREKWSQLTGVAKDGTGTLGIVASQTCYRDARGELDAQVEYLRATRDWLVQALPEAVEGLRVSATHATYLMWLDFRDTALGDLDTPAQWLRRHAKVGLNEGTDFGTGGAGHARLNFATSREILEEAIARIKTAVDKRAAE